MYSKRIFLIALLSLFPLCQITAWAGVEVSEFGVVGTWPADHLFQEIGSPTAAGSQSEPGASSLWPVTVNLDLLASAPQTIVMNLPDRETVTLIRDRSKDRGPGAFLWSGRGGDCSAIFSAIPGKFLADISCINGPYAVKTGFSGAVLTHFSFAAPPAGIGSDIAIFDETEQMGGTTPPGPPPTSPTQDQDIDVMILYTSDVRQAIENENGDAKQAMHLIMDSVQQAMINSSSTGVTLPTVNLVHTQEVAHSETNNLYADTNYLTDQYAVELRDYWGADIVMMVREWQPGGDCGLAYLPGKLGTPPPGLLFAPLAVGVTVRGCTFAKWPFHHEFAHIFGANHSETASNSTPLRDWAYAKWATRFKLEAARTLVSNNPGCAAPCDEVLNFSNAAIYVDWFRTGTPDLKENARVIAEFAPIVAQYRSHVERIFADGFE